MISKKLLSRVSALLKIADYPGPFELFPMSGGKNNRVYLCSQNDQNIGVIKQYYHNKGDLRDRLDTEWKFSRFLWNHEIRQIAEPVVSDPINHIAFYSFIEGNKLNPARIARSHIDQAIDFFFSMNSFRHSADARLLPNASEACFSLEDHIRLIERRILNLKKIKTRSKIDTRAREFVDRELVPVWDATRNATCASAHNSGFLLNDTIPLDHRRLSPSDFGFHNALEDTNGRLYFMDFEYAGWDDPAKMVCDLFCQPAIPVPQQFLSHIIDKVMTELCEPAIQRQRIDILLPVYRIKWCCIVLNEFLPLGRSRRMFTDCLMDSEAVKEEQLQKAIKIIQQVSDNL